MPLFTDISSNQFIPTGSDIIAQNIKPGRPAPPESTITEFETELDSSVLYGLEISFSNPIPFNSPLSEALQGHLDNESPEDTEELIEYIGGKRPELGNLHSLSHLVRNLSNLISYVLRRNHSRLGIERPKHQIACIAAIKSTDEDGTFDAFDEDKVIKAIISKAHLHEDSLEQLDAEAPETVPNGSGLYYLIGHLNDVKEVEIVGYFKPTGTTVNPLTQEVQVTEITFYFKNPILRQLAKIYLESDMPSIAQEF